ncbi:hypothetical protein DCAR_0624569 [Daucus carota subsp. sativus]|uniref:Uncharacterized protein n=1 Tax=Daucus carota subsp. sativus TaxID=79200 RepID=A0AAF0XC91_DAUCS|nr:hypothetical protein DCAR_0624569 [Daucus carota subsp. sativus]
MEGGILVVSAPDGPMPQIKEHILLARQQIMNPAYFELDKPDFEPIAAIGIEIRTNSRCYIVAGSYRQTTWKPKFDVEKEKQKAKEETSSLSKSLNVFSVKPAKEEVTEASNNGEDSSEEKKRNEDTTAAPRRRTRFED